MIKLICFDLWKTLASEPFSLDGYWNPLFERFPNIKRDVVKGLVNQIPMKERLSIEESVEKILFSLGIKDKGLASQISQRWKYSCKRSQLFPEVIPVLRKLKEKEFFLGLITNTSQFGWQQIQKKYNLAAYFDIVAKSFELGVIKPESEIFSYVEKQINVSPFRILMVGDSYSSDIIPTRSRGWQALQIVRDRKSGKEKESLYIQNLYDLENFL